MAAFALAMLAAGLVLMLLTGWASHAVLLAVACVIAGVGVVSGGIDGAVLQALPSRLVGLLENDLLQAIALYALVGALLRHGDIAPQVVEGLAAGMRRIGVGPRSRPALAGFALGALAAPLNGSVGAHVSMLAQAVAPGWQKAGLSAPKATALTAVTATLGVIVPPSLVLLLLGDAMLRAHTEGLTLGGIRNVRVINTQDLIQACAPVALLLTLGWAFVASWQGRVDAPAGSGGNTVGSGTTGRTDRTLGRITAWLVPLAVLLLMSAVAIGLLRAVEAAATAALALGAVTAWRGQLRQGRWTRVLDDAMALTGALFALLIAAGTLSLVLRAAGCDRLVADGLGRLAGHPQAATLAVMAGLLLTGFVLDAFEIVFLVVPIVMPPLLAQVPDAAWVACLALLVLQAGFLLPPWGYAVVLARGMVGGGQVSIGALARQMLPYLALWALVAAMVFAFPTITHWLRSAPVMLDAPAGDGSSVDDLLRSMSEPRRGDGSK